MKKKYNELYSRRYEEVMIANHHHLLRYTSFQSKLFVLTNHNILSLDNLLRILGVVCRLETYKW